MLLQREKNFLFYNYIMKMKTMKTMGKTKKIELWSNLLTRELRPNTYEVWTNWDDTIREDLREWILKWNFEEIIGYFYENYSFEDWKKYLFDQYKELYEKDLLEFLQEKTKTIEKIEVVSKTIKNPSAYNYTWDWIDFDLYIDKEKFIEFVKSLDQWKLENFLYDSYSSRDWFISFTANNLEDLYKWLEEENSQEYGAVINYLLQEYDGEIYIDDSGFYGDFIDDKFFEKFWGENK